MSALNIKDPEVAAMARKLAKLKGETITEAVSQALAESLRNATTDAAALRAAKKRRVDEIVKRFQAKLGPNAPSLRQINEDMYDEDGLPT